MTHHRQARLDELAAKSSDEFVAEYGQYPKALGALSYYYGEAVKLAQALMEELQEKQRKVDALQWAAETILNEHEIHAIDDRGEVYEDLYSAAAAIEKALKGGMTEEQLRKRLRNGLQEDEIQHEQLIEDSERCEGCGEFCGEDRYCKLCVDEHEEADSPA